MKTKSSQHNNLMDSSRNINAFLCATSLNMMYGVYACLHDSKPEVPPPTIFWYIFAGSQSITFIYSHKVQKRSLSICKMYTYVCVRTFIIPMSTFLWMLRREKLELLSISTLGFMKYSCLTDNEMEWLYQEKFGQAECYKTFSVTMSKADNWSIQIHLLHLTRKSIVTDSQWEIVVSKV